MIRIGILMLCLALASQAAARQATRAGATPPAAISAESDIVVQHRADAAIARLVEAMTDAPRGAQVARWNEAICPRVIDLDPVHTSLIEDRIDAVARSLGIAVAKRPCRATIGIIMTPDADALAKGLVERHPGLFGDPTYGIRHGAELSDIEAPRPVRWLSASRTGGANASPILPAETSPNGFRSTLDYDGGSRIQQPTRENLILSLAIVDIMKLSHITWGQLADYLALVTLARPRLSVAAPDSVMSIFAVRDSGGRGPMGLTPNDLALLHGLYNSDASMSAQLQRSQIVDKIKKGAKP